MTSGLLASACRRFASRSGVKGAKIDALLRVKMGQSSECCVGSYGRRSMCSGVYGGQRTMMTFANRVFSYIYRGSIDIADVMRFNWSDVASGEVIL